MSNEHEAAPDATDKSPQAKLARAQQALAAQAKDRELLQAQVEAQHLELEQLRAQHAEAQQAMATLREQATKDVGNRPIALVKIVENKVEEVLTHEGTEKVIVQHVVAKPGDVLGFDPKAAPRGREGLIENQHYRYS